MVACWSAPPRMNFRSSGLADCGAVQLRVNIFQPRDLLPGESDHDVADDDARFVGRPFGFDFQDDCGSFFFALQLMAKRVRQTHRLQADAEIAARDAALLQQRVGDRVDRGGGNSDDAEAAESRSGDADDQALRVDDGAARCGGLQARRRAGCKERARHRSMPGAAARSG